MAIQVQCPNCSGNRMTTREELRLPDGTRYDRRNAISMLKGSWRYRRENALTLTPWHIHMCIICGKEWEHEEAAGEMPLDEKPPPGLLAKGEQKLRDEAEERRRAEALFLWQQHQGEN